MSVGRKSGGRRIEESAARKKGRIGMEDFVGGENKEKRKKRTS